MHVKDMIKDRDLTDADIRFLLEVDEIGDCYKSNKYFVKLLDLEDKYIDEIILRLKLKGYISVIGGIWLRGLADRRITINN